MALALAVTVPYIVTNRREGLSKQTLNADFIRSNIYGLLVCTPYGIWNVELECGLV